MNADDHDAMNHADAHDPDVPAHPHGPAHPNGTIRIQMHCKNDVNTGMDEVEDLKATIREDSKSTLINAITDLPFSNGEV